MCIQKHHNPQDCCLPIKYHRRHWMEQEGLTQSQLAARFGLKSGMSVSKMMNKGVARQKYIDILRDEYGMPENLLPEPSREKTGPIPREEGTA